MTINETIQTFDLARKRSVPFVAINTADQHAMVRMLCDHMDKATEDGWRAQVVMWDSAAGLTGANETGKAWIRKAQSTLASERGVDAAMIAATWQNEPLPSCLSLVSNLGADGAVIVINAHRWLHDALVANAIFRLREAFKGNNRTVILLGPNVELPAELRGDVVVIEDPLPGDDELAGIVDALHEAAGASMSSEDRPRVIDALRGLSAFGAEQIGALAMNEKTGINALDALKRKRGVINSTKGIEYVLGGPKTNEIAGLKTVVEFGERVFEGEDKPRLVVLLDEMEKAIGNAQGADSHEVTKDQLGTLLRRMEDWRADGMIAAGVPGSGKTLFAQALGNTYGVPLLRLDLGELKGRYVGDSEQAIREAMKLIYSLSNGRVFFIGTVNRMESLPAELLRRFRFGVWMFDLPTDEERTSLWKFYMAQNGIEGAIPESDGWTGAEIRNACEFARRLHVTLPEAMRYVVPIVKSSAEMIRSLRETAKGRYLSASYPGVYVLPTERDAAEPAFSAVPKRRTFKSN